MYYITRLNSSGRAILNDACQICGAFDWTVVKLVNRGGQVTYPYVCNGCQTKTCVHEKKSVAEALPYVPTEIFYIDHSIEGAVYSTFKPLF